MIFLWRLSSGRRLKYVSKHAAMVFFHGNLGMDIKENRPMGWAGCVYPTLLKPTVSVSWTLSKLGSVKTSVSRH